MTISAYRTQLMLDLDEVANLLKVSTQTVRRLIRRGQLRAYRIGGQLRFRKDEVEAYIESQAVPPEDVEENGEDHS